MIARTHSKMAFRAFVRYHLCFNNPEGKAAHTWWCKLSEQEIRRLLCRWAIATTIRCDSYLNFSLHRRFRAITQRHDDPRMAEKVWRRFLRRTARHVNTREPLTTLLDILHTNRFTLRVFHLGWRALPPHKRATLVRLWTITSRQWESSSGLKLPQVPRHGLARVIFRLTPSEAGQRFACSQV